MGKRKAKVQLIDIDRPIYKVWQGIYLSFFSKRFYIDVLKRWKGLSWLYIVLALSILCFPLYVKLAYQCHHYINRDVFQVLEQIPIIPIKEGKAFYDKPMPYAVKNRDGLVLGWVDTNKKMKEAYLWMKPPVFIYLCEDGILVNPSSNLLPFGYKPRGVNLSKLNGYSFDKYMHGEFDAKQIIQSLHPNRILYGFILALYPLLISMFFVIFSVFFMLMGFMGKLMAQVILKTPLKYVQSCRLFALCSTPSLLILFMTLTAQVTFPGLGMILMVMMYLYFSLAVLAYRSEAKQLVRV
jgi:hypothetical protein